MLGAVGLDGAGVLGGVLDVVLGGGGGEVGEEVLEGDEGVDGDLVGLGEVLGSGVCTLVFAFFLAV